MSRQLPDDPFAGWPPIIESAEVPQAIRIRDWLLTLLMWGILLLILATELRVALEAIAVLRGRSDAEIDPALAEFLQRLRPLLLLVAGLTVALAVATLASRARRERAVRAPQPRRLDPARLAARAGLALAAMEDARAHRVATVHRLAGGLVVRPGPPANEGRP